MKEMTLDTIAHVTSGQLFYPKDYKVEVNKEIQGVVSDNRKVEKDYLFVPFVGARVDGHDLIGDAFDKGAYACLSMKELKDAKGPYILVEDTGAALKQIATAYREKLSIPVIGVIGSVGKTSTKEMLASVLGVRYKVLKTEGNFNNEIGLPLTICRIDDTHEVAVVEMGISDFGEMHRLGDIAKPDFAVMTNIGQCHLEFLKDRDGILRAKTEVFEHMPKTGMVVLNGDDDKLQIADTLGLRKEYFGLNGQNFSASDIRADGVQKTKATIHTPKGDAKVTIPLPGEHNVMNGLAAAVVGMELGMSLDEVVQGLESASTISGRNNVISVHGVTIIDDCYNANPVSMKASLEILSKATGRTIAVLGDMGELGEDARMLHYGLGQTVMDCKISMLFTVGELSEAIGESLKEGNSSIRHHHYKDVDTMLEDLLPLIETGDTILIKASHFMNFSRVVDAIKERFK